MRGPRSSWSARARRLDWPADGDGASRGCQRPRADRGDDDQRHPEPRKPRSRAGRGRLGRRRRPGASRRLLRSLAALIVRALPRRSRRATPLRSACRARAPSAACAAGSCTSRGTTSSVIIVATTRPPMTARPSGAFCSPPSPSASAIGSMPRTIASAVISTGRRRVSPARSAASVADSRSFLGARLVGEADQQDRVRDRDADRHDRAHERLDVQRRRRSPPASRRCRRTRPAPRP